MYTIRNVSFTILVFLLLLLRNADSQTVALWLFDEQVGLYPSSILSDQSENDFPLVLGEGGTIVPGMFGNALEPTDRSLDTYPEGEVIFGLTALPVPEGRKIEPMTWMNARFCALSTRGENHLRKDVDMPNPTETKLNLGDFDWTIELWFQPSGRTGDYGTLYEIGEGPRGENDNFTRISLSSDCQKFLLQNQPSGITTEITTLSEFIEPSDEKWYHLAFVYSAEKKEIRHYVDGEQQSVTYSVFLQSLRKGNEAYLSIGRDGIWKHPFQGKIDELRISEGILYDINFQVPASFSPVLRGEYAGIELIEGPPLLFPGEKNEPVQLGNRKHLMIDDVLVSEMENVTFTVNPPMKAERVFENIEGPFRKHLTVLEDEDGLIRIYNSIHDDRLAVRTSQDGIHWDIPDMGKGEYRGQKNIVIPEPVGGLGNPFIDPNGPPERRWKYITGYNDRGIFLYTSSDGWNWERLKTAMLPFRSGTQSCTYYDDQRQLYVSYHRTGITKTPNGATQRESVYTETADLYYPVAFTPATRVDYEKASETMRLRDPLPWYLDNGPLCPGGFGIEFPHKFAPVDTLDPPETDIYVTKAMKYPWAPDTYLAFPIVYFHYEVYQPLTRFILMQPERQRGSGPVETQLAVSRDGIHWKRYPRPAYVGNGIHEGWNVNQAYIAQGMVRRGNEIWQYYFGTGFYHSSYSDDESERAVYRLVQRLDGFVSADTPYDRYGYIRTRPLTFEGNCLKLNIDTDAAGYAQVGILDEKGNPVPGFSVADCIYINGDFTETEVEWLQKGTDVSELSGRTVQLVFQMRGSKLYSFQFGRK